MAREQYNGTRTDGRGLELCCNCWDGYHYYHSRTGETNDDPRGAISNCLQGDCECPCIALLHDKPKPISRKENELIQEEIQPVMFIAYYPTHHQTCFCIVCRGEKPGHVTDRCHCKRCLELASKTCATSTMIQVPVNIWDEIQDDVAAMSKSWYVSPMGEISGIITVEVEDDQELLELWGNIIGN